MSKPELSWQEKAKNMAAGIRKRVLEHTIKNNGGYMSQACSSAEIFAALYSKILKLEPSKGPLEPKPYAGVPSGTNLKYSTGAYFNGAKNPEYDRFILSPTHYSLVLYAALIEAGRMSENSLDQFNRDGSSVEMIGAEHSPGMEVMTGSLGQGLSQAAGIALARKMKKEEGRVIVMMSDGEFQIGMTWESLQFISHHKLDNMVIIVDVNKQQCDGTVNSVMKIDPLDKRLEAFGARVFKLYGHNINELASRAELKPDGRVLVILAETDPCQGLSLLSANAPKLHYLRFKNDEEKAKYEEALKRMVE